MSRFNLELGISTAFCFALDPFRILVSISAIGSVIDIMQYSLTGGPGSRPGYQLAFMTPGRSPRQGQFTKSKMERNRGVRGYRDARGPARPPAFNAAVRPVPHFVFVNWPWRRSAGCHEGELVIPAGLPGPPVKEYCICR